MRYLCFRFDIDTELCLTKGVPNLLNLADEMDIKFTFFVNMGKAIYIPYFLKNFFQLKKDNTKHLSAFKKLGFYHFLKTALFNPNVGSSHLDIIRKIKDYGHEVGLHGGKNHAVWTQDIHNMSEGDIEHELNWALNKLGRINVVNPMGFASPQWVHTQKLYNVLSRLGFLYAANEHGSDLEKIKKVNKLPIIPTNILGEPGGVGFFEYNRAINRTDSQIIKDFSSYLQHFKKFAILYDHPYHAGIKELSILKNLISIAMRNNVRIGTLREVINETI